MPEVSPNTAAPHSGFQSSSTLQRVVTCYRQYSGGVVGPTIMYTTLPKGLPTMHRFLNKLVTWRPKGDAYDALEPAGRIKGLVLCVALLVLLLFPLVVELECTNRWHCNHSMAVYVNNTTQGAVKPRCDLQYALTLASWYADSAPRRMRTMPWYLQLELHKMWYLLCHILCGKDQLTTHNPWGILLSTLDTLWWHQQVLAGSRLLSQTSNCCATTANELLLCALVHLA